uniref:Uncharacterized protein n=1 Tax=Triticum urartu TaxID=4572 RepID=A0A8R7TW57_TRIUA
AGNPSITNPVRRSEKKTAAHHARTTFAYSSSSQQTPAVRHSTDGPPPAPILPPPPTPFAARRSNHPPQPLSLAGGFPWPCPVLSSLDLIEATAREWRLACGRRHPWSGGGCPRERRMTTSWRAAGQGGPRPSGRQLRVGGRGGQHRLRGRGAPGGQATPDSDRADRRLVPGANGQRGLRQRPTRSRARSLSRTPRNLFLLRGWLKREYGQ